MCDCISPSAYKENIRKARKQHKCCECANNILKGDNYQYASGVWDGYPGDYKTCLSCVSVRREFEQEYDCCIAFGELKEVISDCSLCVSYGYGVNELIEDSDNKEGIKRS
jgi:hypothetical protein